MKVGDMRTSSYIAKNDVVDDLTVTIARWEYKDVSQDNEDAQMKCILYFREHPKPLILNVTNAETIQDNFGTDETDEWVGQQITLFYDMTVRYGKNKGGIRVKAASPPPIQKKEPSVEYGFDDDIPQ